MRIALLTVVALMLSGCAVKYRPAVPKTERVDSPAVGQVSKAQIGDHMLTKGVLVEQEAMDLRQPVDGFAYDILQGVYPKLGDSDTEQFFSPVGVIRNPIADPFQALSVQSENPKQVCVVTAFGVRA